MSKKNQDLQACGIDIENPKEDDSFLEVNTQAQIDNEVPYPNEYSPACVPPYTPPTTSLTTSTQETWREKRHEANLRHVVQYHSQGRLLPHGTEHQQQFYPQVQYIVRQEAQGGYLDMTKVQQVTQPAPNVPDYIFLSVLVCLFCCWSCGICAIIASKQAQTYSKRGDYVEAKSSARCAFYLIITSVVFGLLSMGLAIAKYFQQF